MGLIPPFDETCKGAAGFRNVLTLTSSRFDSLLTYDSQREFGDTRPECSSDFESKYEWAGSPESGTIHKSSLVSGVSIPVTMYWSSLDQSDGHPPPLGTPC